MRPILTPSEASSLDAAAEERGISTPWLMENAGEALASVALRELGGAYGRRVLVLCGKGNNGGDGAVAARYLDRAGVRVALAWLDEPGGHAAQMRGRCMRETTVREVALAGIGRELERTDLVIDAIFGTGFRGVVEGGAADVVGALDAARLRRPAVRVVAADIPSGVDGLTGVVAGPVVSADATVAFGALKPGCVLYPGASFVGRVDVADIGFPPDLVDAATGLLESADVAALLPQRADDTHKREAGSVLVAAGSRQMAGAAALVAQGAYRAGAGLVTVATPESAVSSVSQHVAEAVFLPLPETDEGEVRVDGVKALWDRLGEFGSFAIGPGLGRSEDAAAFARDLAVGAQDAVVLDADGLNAFAGDASFVTDRGARHLVLTPHAGEFARLSGRSVEEVEADRIGAARSLATVTQATVLLKGSRTVIAGYGMAESALGAIPLVDAQGSVTFLADRHPDPVRVNPTGSSYLATAGSGDVLTGVIAALLAQGLSGLDAASVGAYVHGLAGALAAQRLGDGTTAGDIAACVPAAVESVLTGMWEADGP